jgi:hypothetical protein
MPSALASIQSQEHSGSIFPAPASSRSCTSIADRLENVAAHLTKCNDIMTSAKLRFAQNQKKIEIPVGETNGNIVKFQ